VAKNKHDNQATSKATKGKEASHKKSNKKKSR
jgi:hypothetical protein